ncbi:MAG: hypothetical protein O9342_00010 [Beijerinckiaceae bacterium]|nr:hypothetical protein [Beijerinckiaceae bacterium]
MAYGSSDPEGFASGAQVLVAAGFGLSGVTPVDQFRHSPHVELVSSFKGQHIAGSISAATTAATIAATPSGIAIAVARAVFAPHRHVA